MAYEARKAAQLIAYLIKKSGGRSLNLLKTVKLVYLADRESVARYGFPILDEPRYSLDHGPINSKTLNRINGGFNSEIEELDWSEYLTDREHNEIGLSAEGVSLDDLDELSEADIECLDAVWERFGHMTPSGLRNWTHDNLPEWQDPNGGRIPITMLGMMRGIGIDDAEHMARLNESFKDVDLAFAMARAG
ncbi:Panacea domain-containing protein [Rhizobium sp. FKL33]|uniref:Panacea domain-containing protein n=1 Tax=Rhizobium sp. FKL33 TaxID=2562307 RepID=UPI0010C05301|nr:Panacea domain-containing protein [Rhizobium sp. FKL33]